MVLTPNHIFVPVAYLGITGAGRIFSGANPVYTATEVEYQIRNTGTCLILTHPSLAEVAIEAGRRAGLPKDRIYLFSDHGCKSFAGLRDWRTVPVEPDFAWDPLGRASKSTLATINYSSGTTGLPKGVCVSHFNIVANSEQTIFMRNIETSQQDERWLGFLPLYHSYGKSSKAYFPKEKNLTNARMQKVSFTHVLWRQSFSYLYTSCKNFSMKISCNPFNDSRSHIFKLRRPSS